MIKIYTLFFISFFTIGTAYCQNKFAGRVCNSKTKEPLAFVNIVYNSKNHGTTTDLDGYFTIDYNDKIEFLKISYLGYLSKNITKEEIGSKHYIDIKLEENAFHLSEVTILPGINPAHRIIEEVTKNADKNNPEKMRSFSYTSYNKMYFTIDSDKLFNKVDSTNNERISDDNKKIDTLENGSDAFKNFFASKHLFITESITERKFRYPDNNKEVVLAQRMSGLKNPGFVLLTSQSQSLSFYDDYLSIMDKKYLSPVSKGSTKRYFFQIEDTIYNERADTIFIIFYRPLKGKNFDGIQGVLHINSNGYAIQNVSAKPYEKSKMFDINIQQKYEFIEETQWFPVQLNTDIVMHFVQLADDDSTSAPIMGIGKSYISDISLNPDNKRREFNQLNVSVKDDAHKKSEDFWNIYRKDTLTEKDKKTYEFIDSVGEEINIDRYLNLIEIVATGNIPWKFINFDIKSVYWYNQYEGSRLGLGISTNDRFLPWASVGGYFAYGFKDKAWKYGGNLSFLLHKPSDTKLTFGYKKDLQISDNIIFHTAPSFSLTNAVLDMFLSEMDSITQYYTAFQFSTLKYLKANIKFSYTEKDIINTLRYDYIHPIEKHYFNSEVGIYLRYAYKEKFMQTPKGNRLSLGTKFPILSFNIIKGISFLDSKSDYLKFESSIYKKFTIRNAGETHILISGGLVDGIVPYSQLYSIAGINTWLNFDNNFNTMGINEFISDRFACIFLRHNFGNLLFKTKKFAPELVLVTSAGWGDAYLIKNNTNSSSGKLMNKGYFESGIQINNIFVMNNIFGYGLGVYYRYGPYSKAKEINNWAFKLNITYKF